MASPHRAFLCSSSNYQAAPLCSQQYFVGSGTERWCVWCCVRYSAELCCFWWHLTMAIFYRQGSALFSNWPNPAPWAYRKHSAHWSPSAHWSSSARAGLSLGYSLPPCFGRPEDWRSEGWSWGIGGECGWVVLSAWLVFWLGWLRFCRSRRTDWWPTCFNSKLY